MPVVNQNQRYTQTNNYNILYNVLVLVEEVALRQRLNCSSSYEINFTTARHCHKIEFYF